MALSIGEFSWRMESDFSQFGDASDLDPLDDEDVAGVIETGSVRRNEFAGREMVAGLGSRLPPFAGGIVAEVRDHLVVLVEQGHARAEIGHHDVAIAEEAEVAGQL